MIMKHKDHETNQGCVLQVLFLYAAGTRWSGQRNESKFVS